MKKIYLLSLLLIAGFWVGKAKAQTYLNFTVSQPPALVADAGVDGIICPGDSAALGGNDPATGGTAPYTYAWSPTSGVDNPASGQPMASPTVNTTYVMTVTDSLNCTAFDSAFVEVDTCVGIEEMPEMEAFQLYPNPNSGTFRVDLNGHTTANLNLLVTDLSGKVLYEEEILPLNGLRQKEVQLPELATGSYLFIVELEGRRISRRLFIHK